MKKNIPIIIGVCVFVIIVLAASALLQKGRSVETVVSSGVDGLYTARNNKLYYRSGESLVLQDLKTKSVQKIEAKFNSADLSEDGGRLFVRTMTDYKLKGKIYDLKTDSYESTVYTNFIDNLWCNNQLVIVQEQKNGGYTVLNEKGKALYSNVPSSQLYCVQNNLVYDSTLATSTTIEEREVRLRFLAEKKSEQELNVGSPAGPILQSASGLWYFEHGNKLSQLTPQKKNQFKLGSTENLLSKEELGTVYVLGSNEQTGKSITLTTIDVLSGNNASVGEYALTKGQQLQSTNEKESTVIYKDGNYLYFVLNNTIARLKL